jgi:hypothetical protein
MTPQGLGDHSKPANAIGRIRLHGEARCRFPLINTMFRLIPKILVDSLSLQLCRLQYKLFADSHNRNGRDDLGHQVVDPAVDMASGSMGSRFGLKID